MTTLMFYKKPIAIDRDAHRAILLKPIANDYEFAAICHSVPLAAVEFSQAALEYPIVFAMDDNGRGAPVAMTGVREDENLFVTADKQWDAAYIPAFVRRYPFVLHANEAQENFTLFVDEEYPGFDVADGERMFNEDGTETPMMAQTLEFLLQCHHHAQRSNALVECLKKHDLLVPQSAEIKSRAGAAFTLQGFHVVDHERLMALPDATLVELARSGDLAQIYAHLLSLGNLQKLVLRLEQRLPASATA